METSTFKDSLPALKRLLELRQSWKLGSKEPYTTDPALHKLIRQQIELLSISVPAMSMGKLVESLQLLMQDVRRRIDPDMNPKEEAELLGTVLERVQYAFKVGAPDTKYAEYLDAIEQVSLLGKDDQRIKFIMRTLANRMLTQVEENVSNLAKMGEQSALRRELLRLPKEEEECHYPKFENQLEKILFRKKQSDGNADAKKKAASDVGK